VANPFDNPKIFVDDVSVNYTNPTLGIVNGQKSGSWSEVRDPFAGAKSGLGGNAGTNNDNKTLKLDAAKTVAKAKLEAKKPPQPKSLVETLTDTFYGVVGIDKKTYESAIKAASDRANKLYATITKGANNSDFIRNTTRGLKFSINELSTVMGLPYQWMSLADNRIKNNGNTNYGRKYYEKILSKMPLLVLTPGIPDFMAGYSDEKRKSILGNLFGSAFGVNDIKGKKNEEMRYYTLQFEAEEYYRYVNSMCTALSIFLGISDQKYQGQTIRTINWFERSNNALAHNYSYYGGVGFYLNSETQISESFGNESTKSILADKLNGMSDVGREVQFLTGISGLDVDVFMSKGLNAAAPNVDAMTKNAGTGTMSGFMGMIMNGTRTVFAGGKLEFPELWADSSYSTSYSVNMKLVSPDYDRRSWFINIGVPLMHLIALCAPRQVSPNGYVSPFLVRAFYRGFFNVDMGLLSMSVQKGSEGGWTIDGLPTTVDVSLDIRDLYSKLTISNETILGGPGNAFGNVGLMTYLANIAGVNINEPDISRTVRLYAALKEQAAANLPYNISTRVNNYVANLITNRVFGKN
jgi:hypothetical protein